MSEQKSKISQEAEIIVVHTAPKISLTEDEKAGDALLKFYRALGWEEDEKAGDALLKFYRALGWDGQDILDPCKIRTNEAVYNRLKDIMFERCPDPVSVGMTMVNIGPSVDNSIPVDKVYLFQGWTTQADGGDGI